MNLVIAVLAGTLAVATDSEPRAGDRTVTVYEPSSFSVSFLKNETVRFLIPNHLRQALTVEVREGDRVTLRGFPSIVTQWSPVTADPRVSPFPQVSVGTHVLGTQQLIGTHLAMAGGLGGTPTAVAVLTIVNPDATPRTATVSFAVPWPLSDRIAAQRQREMTGDHR